MAGIAEDVSSRCHVFSVTHFSIEVRGCNAPRGAEGLPARAHIVSIADDNTFEGEPRRADDGDVYSAFTKKKEIWRGVKIF